MKDAIPLTSVLLPRREEGVRIRFASAVTLYVLCTAVPAPATAAPAGCFEIAGGKTPAAHSSSRRVTLATRIRTSERCEYALAPNGPWVALSAAGVDGRDFATFVLELGGADRGEAPSAVYARSVVGGVESVFLAGCTEYLLSRGKGFEMRVPVDSPGASVRRIAGADDCGAASLALRFVPDAGTSGEAPLFVRKGPWATTLAVGQRALVLEPGRWVVYASGPDVDAGLLVGRIDTKSPLSPLRAALLALAREEAPEPWLRASWASGRLQLEPISAAVAAGDAWAELRAAAAAGALWLEDPAARESEVAAMLAFEADGSAIAFPAQPIDTLLAARYGRASSYFVPTLSDWSAIRDDASLCLAGRYPAPVRAESTAAGEELPPPPPSLARVPERTCVALSRVVAPFSVRGGRAPAAGQICVQRTHRVMSAGGVVPGPELAERCVAVPIGAEREPEPEFMLATVGDALTFAGVGGEKLYACVDNECQPLPSGGKWLPLARSGLVEIRQVEQPGQARSRAGLALVRLGVLDPASEWHPLGLYGAVDAPAADRWTALDHDEEDVFAFVRGRQALRFALSTSPALAAAWNARAPLETRMTHDLPLVVGMQGGIHAPPGSALVALATREAACPNVPAREAREQAIDPEALLVDERFYVQLAHYRGEAEPYDCLASAGFRVTESLSRRAISNVRLGLVGDVQGMVFLNRPAGVGLALPLAYGRMRLGLGLGIDVSASVTSAIAFDRADLTRAGLGFSAMLSWGPERVAPRIVGVGAMLHVATGTDEDREPMASLVAALDLSTLLDMAGGR